MASRTTASIGRLAAPLVPSPAPFLFLGSLLRRRLILARLFARRAFFLCVAVGRRISDGRGGQRGWVGAVKGVVANGEGGGGGAASREGRAEQNHGVTMRLYRVPSLEKL